MKDENKWIQPIRFFVVATIFIATIWFIMSATPLLSTVTISALLAYLLHPVVKFVTVRTKLSRKAAVNAVYGVFLVILLAIPSFLVPILISQATTLTSELDFHQIESGVRDFLSQPLSVAGVMIPLDGLLSNSSEALNQTTTTIVSGAVSVIATLSNNVVWVLLGMVMIYYLLRDSPALIDWFISVIPEQYQMDAHILLIEIDSVWGGFLRGQFVLVLIVGFLSWLGVALMGIPGAIIIGIIAGVFDLVPSLGPILAAVIAMAVAFIEGSTYLPISNGMATLLIMIVFIVIQQAENIWFRPAVMGSRLKLHPALIIVGVLASLTLFGILEALVIVPVMATVGVLTRYFYYRLFLDRDPFPDTLPYVERPDVEEITSRVIDQKSEELESSS